MIATTSNAPAWWAASAIAVRSSIEPKKLGDWTTTAAVVLSIRNDAGSIVPASV